jgi:hypothetical protein
MRLFAAASLIVLSVAVCAFGDSVFDIEGIGRDVIATTGETRALAGAVSASTDPLSCSIMSPCASAFADRVTIAAGFAHTSTVSRNILEKKRTITTLFPSILVIVPAGRVSVLSGLFAEKQGRLTLGESGSYLNTMYDAQYRKESSIHSVPLMLSARMNPGLVVSAGIIFSFLDSRETTTIDFRSNEYSDTEDVSDLYGTGGSFAVGLVLDFEKISIGGLFRNAAEMDATLERENMPSDLWSSEDMDISSRNSYSLGFRVKPADMLWVEIDYHRLPWSRLEFNGNAVSDKAVDRYAAGMKYTGDYIWNASRYPLNAGYYRQPLDWENDITGEIIEEVFSFGTSIPLADDRAKISLALEIGQRKSKASGQLDETILAFSLSLSAIEAWHREIGR